MLAETVQQHPAMVGGGGGASAAGGMVLDKVVELVKWWRWNGVISFRFICNLCWWWWWWIMINGTPGSGGAGGGSGGLECWWLLELLEQRILVGVGGGGGHDNGSGGKVASGIVIVRYLTYGTLYLGSTNTSSADLAEYYVSGGRLHRRRGRRCNRA